MLWWSIVVAFIYGTVSGKGRGGRSKAGEGLGGGRGAPNAGVVAAALGVIGGGASRGFRCGCFAVVVG